ncbi:MAG: 4-hydroxythreonine-4-phosphate dehydrogenase PdxA [Saprospiraceae bacterium]|nr:4-hydroxythreonine-4-phosphate dehydrogenase PdxA [Saprospiraceae bacterium]
MTKIKIGITLGDVNGIGPEIIIKSLNKKEVLNHFTPIIYGSSKVIAYHKNIVTDPSFNFSSISGPEKAFTGRVNVINCWDENVNITLGKATEDGGKFALLSLEKATFDLKSGNIDAMVTAPINKQAMKMAGFEHIGHTEYITDQLGGKSLMMMVSDIMRVALVSNHLPLKEAAQAMTRETLESKLNIFHKSLQRDFGIEKPVIAVLGLNPHAGDEGTIGTEEQEIIRPVIIEAKKSGMLIMGPYPADGFFGSSKFSKVDGILAMYHDQGLIPFKALSFGRGINFTAGLSGIRTSPDHGTAFDIVGKNEADPGSFREALYAAKEIVINRRQYESDRKNVLKKKPKPSEELSE